MARSDILAQNKYVDREHFIDRFSINVFGTKYCHYINKK